MMAHCPDCCKFHDIVRWLWGAFATGEFWFGVILGIVALIIFALLSDF